MFVGVHLPSPLRLVEDSLSSISIYILSSSSMHTRCYTALAPHYDAPLTCARSVVLGDRTAVMSELRVRVPPTLFRWRSCDAGC